MPKAAQHSPKLPSPPRAALWIGPALPGELRAGRSAGIAPAGPGAQRGVAGGGPVDTQVCALITLVELERLQWFPQVLQWLFLAKEHVQKANLIMASFSPETRGFVEKPR